MANPDHLAILKQGVKVWNEWREDNPLLGPDLSGADLSGLDLSGLDPRMPHLRGVFRPDIPEAYLIGVYITYWFSKGVDLTRTNLHGANLKSANLHGANLHGADLRATNLTQAVLTHSILTEVNLSGANLDRAILFRASLARANLSGADMRGAFFLDTRFGATSLFNCQSLETCEHFGPSSIDFRTLQRSGPLPKAFLRGCGLPDVLIEYLPSLLNEPLQFYSCFISYSSKDQKFTQKLHDDLQDKGVRCWFAPENLKIGDRLHETIDESIKLREKLLLILSHNSIGSAWVEREVRIALEEEKRRGETMLYPVRLDDAVMDSTTQWAARHQEQPPHRRLPEVETSRGLQREP